MRQIKYLWVFVFLTLRLHSAFGFALIGPFAPWMTAQLTYQDGGHSIGGPMDIGEGYRWNIPVVTYGFDQSFLNYFGSNGVTAVQSAIQILNDLPPASANSLTNYPLAALRYNFAATGRSMYDLKSFALPLILEHLGLAQPTRFTYCLSNYSSQTDYTIIMRNFDPVTLQPSDIVNGTEYDYFVGPVSSPFELVIAFVQVEPRNPQEANYTAVADDTVSAYSQLTPGAFIGLGLTRDDVGGLNYLLNTNNLALESLIPGVTGYGTNAGNYVNTAVRPGVDKITFQQLPYDCVAGRFIAITNQYVDSFVTNNVIRQQTLQRIITQPDILFTVQDVETQSRGTVFQYTRTGTSNWVNNGAPFNDGPGVIQPPVVIAFDTLGPSLEHFGTPDYANNANNFLSSWTGFWGSFDGSTNVPMAYPISPATNVTEFRFALAPNSYFSWNIHGQTNEIFLLQTSIDLSNWTTITNITNSGGTFSYLDDIQDNSTQRFYRTIPQ